MTKIKRERESVQTALRDIIKVRSIKYSTIAEKIGISERTVKRLFAGTEDISFDRLVDVCEAIDIDFFDLMQRAARPELKTFTVSEVQERFFLENPHHLGYFSELAKGKAPGEIAAKYNLTTKSTQRYLRDLEQQTLLERLPNDQCRVLFTGNLIALASGPMAKASMGEAAERIRDFLADLSDQSKIGALVTSSTRMSRRTVETCTEELTSLINTFHQRARYDGMLAAKDLVPVEWALGIAGPLRAFPSNEPVNLEGFHSKVP